MCYTWEKASIPSFNASFDKMSWTAVQQEAEENRRMKNFTNFLFKSWANQNFITIKTSWNTND
jgi:hypothetical protein